MTICAAAWDAMGRSEAVLERFIAFDREVSIIVARGVAGWMSTFGLIENTHANHILDISVVPASVAPEVEARAAEIARGVAESLGLVGVLCVEFFLTPDGELLINELAPRPHNSGHLTIDASMTSQFEQQVRAICGLPVGSTELLRPAAMANLLGDLWADGEPDWAAACALPGVKLHLYGKAEPRPGRKMGHLTALASSPREARQLARFAHGQRSRALGPDGPRAGRARFARHGSEAEPVSCSSGASGHAFHTHATSSIRRLIVSRTFPVNDLRP